MQTNINNNMNDFTKKAEEVALYVRVSTEEQALNGDSLRTQREELTRYAIANGLHVYGIYEDDGFSATNLKRPAIQRLLKDVEQNKINRILITKLDRLSRGVRNYYKILDTLDAHNVYWQTIFEKYDSSTANGRLHINIMLSVAENESAQTSERIRSVFKTKVESKELISGKIPIGLKRQDKKLVIDEDKKQIVLDAFRFYKETTSTYRTFEKLDLKYPELQLNYHITRRILTNKLYIGIKKTRYGDIKDFCPSIIDVATFNNTQNLLHKNARKHNFESGGYIFQGMLRCAECGYVLGGKYYAHNGDTYKYYYICRRHHHYLKCSCTKNFNEYKIEEKLLQEFNKQLSNYIANYEYHKKNQNTSNLPNEINILENKLTKLKDLYVRDLIRIEDYEKDYKEYITQLDQLYKQHESADKPIQENDNIDELKSFLNKDFNSIYNKLSRLEKRRIWLSSIDYIVLDKDYNMKIFFI